MHRQMGQPSLVDSLLPGTLGRNERLERMAGGKALNTCVMTLAIWSAPLPGRRTAMSRRVWRS